MEDSCLPSAILKEPQPLPHTAPAPHHHLLEQLGSDSLRPSQCP